MVKLGYFAIRAKKVGLRDSMSYSYRFKYVFCSYLDSYQLVKRDMLWCEISWTTRYPEQMELLPDYLTKPQNSKKQASISFFVSQGPQMLTTSVSMVRFKSLGHVFEIQLLKPTILHFWYFQISPKRSVWVIMLLELKYWGLETPYPIVKG